MLQNVVFPGAIGANHADDLAGRNRYADVFSGDHRTKGLPQAAGLEQRLRHRVPAVGRPATTGRPAGRE